MKNLLNLYFTIGATLLTLSSCGDDQIDNYEEKTKILPKIEVVNLNSNLNNKNISDINNVTRYSGEFLSFQSYEDFISTYNMLEQEMEINQEYINTKVGIVNNEEELDAKFQQYNLDPLKPLKDFEKKYNYTSLRSDISIKETEWLSRQSDIFDSEDPDNHFILDNILRTLLNKDAEIMVAGTILRNEEWGYIEIYNSDLTSYNKKYDAQSKEASNINVKIVNYPNTTNVCKVSTSYEYDFNTDTRRKMKIQSALQRDALFRNNRIISKTKYLKKVVGVWLHKSADLYVKLQGFHGYDNRCGDNNPIFTEKRAYAGEIEVKFVNPMPAGARSDLSIVQNKLFSTHEVWNTNRKIIDLYSGLK